MSEYFHDTAAAAEFRDEKMNKVNLFESHRLFCDVYCLRPGQEQKVHDHADNDKVYHVLTGTPTVIIGDDRSVVGPGTTAIAPAGVPHGLRNDSEEDATLLVVMAPHPRPPASQAE
ncbi:MAG: cupin domain-containing protein [Phycisphaera sp.]|nr:cupin domain-containing protein [Phycisphaera sp.]